MIGVKKWSSFEGYVLRRKGWSEERLIGRIRIIGKRTIIGKKWSSYEGWSEGKDGRRKD